MVRMAVGDPHEPRGANRGALLFASVVRLRPASEIRRAFDPGVGDQQRAAIVNDERGVSDGVESEIQGVLLRSGLTPNSIPRCAPRTSGTNPTRVRPAPTRWTAAGSARAASAAGPRSRSGATRTDPAIARA